MKVLFLCNLAPRKTGSFEALLVALGRSCQATGDEIASVFADEPIAEVGKEMQAAGCGVRAVRGWAEGQTIRPWRFVRPALRLLREARPDVAVVHFGNEFPALVTAILGKFFGLRTRWVWQQDQQIRDPGLISSRVSRLRALMSVFDRFVAVYEGGRRSMELRGIPSTSISVIHNSAPDWDRQRESGWLRQECGVPDDACLCVTVSSLIPRKRVDAMLHAFARIDATPEPYLIVVGDGPDRSQLAGLSERMGVDKRVRFLGLRNDVREILLDADLLVHTATAEACSYAIIESMASGIPAVVTESGAAREQIVDGETGYVMARDDMDGFAVRLSELIRDAELRKVMGAKARQRWRERYRVEVAAAKYQALYRSLAEGSVGEMECCDEAVRHPVTRVRSSGKD